MPEYRSITSATKITVDGITYHKPAANGNYAEDFEYRSTESFNDLAAIVDKAIKAIGGSNEAQVLAELNAFLNEFAQDWGIVDIF